MVGVRTGLFIHLIHTSMYTWYRARTDYADGLHTIPSARRPDMSKEDEERTIAAAVERVRSTMYKWTAKNKLE